MSEVKTAFKKNPKQSAFLAAYARVGTIAEASRLAKINRNTHNDWIKADPDYPAAFEAAKDQLVETLEAEVIRSATVGIEEPVIYQGSLCRPALLNDDGSIKRDEKGDPMMGPPLTIRKRNDVAAFFLLKALRPDKYRENHRVELTGSVALISDRLAAARARLQLAEPDQS